MKWQNTNPNSSSSFISSLKRRLSPRDLSILEKLQKLILQCINDSRLCNITIPQFINLALFEPELGYYNNDLEKIGGKKRDFITAPHISSLFAASIVSYILEILKKEKIKNIIEIGPGEGVLAKQLLMQLANKNIKINSYVLFDLSPQKQLIAIELAKLNNINVVVCNTLQDLKKYTQNSIVIANEVLDAIAPHLIRAVLNIDNDNKNKFKKNTKFKWSLGFVQNISKISYNPKVNFIPLEKAQKLDLLSKIELQELSKYLTSTEEFLLNNNRSFTFNPNIKEKDICDIYFEVNLQSFAFLNSLFAIGNNTNFLLFDYGHLEQDYNFWQNMGSIRSYFQHQLLNDFTLLPGISDITHSVNFSHLLQFIHSKPEVEKIKFYSQAEFLLENQLEQNYKHKLQSLHNGNNNNKEVIKLSQEVQQLMLDMGQVFKAVSFKI